VLKDAIKEKNTSALAGIDARNLYVWDVSIPVDGDTDLEAQVKDLKILERKPLLPVQPLCGTFHNAVEQYLHVIVRAPTVSVHVHPILSCPRQITRSFAGLKKVDELVGNILNVTLYVNTLNKWSAEDIRLEKNHIFLHFTFDNRQPSLSFFRMS
jgi:hypothetical protein